MAIEVSGCHLVLVICGQQPRPSGKGSGHGPRDVHLPSRSGPRRYRKGHSRRTAQTGIEGPHAPDGRSAQHRDRARVPGRPANNQDQATIANLPGHKTAKAISAANTDAEST
jgi:hypothetical protein